MFVVGLTGGIGSGKTAVSDRFAALGIRIVDADVVAREVVEPGTEALQRIAEHFGAGILSADGHLDRAALRQIVFANEPERKWLEALLHPVIGEELVRQLNSAGSPYAILVSPLLIEAGQSALCRRLLIVDVPVELQLERTMGRDGNTREQVERIIAAQASREQRLAWADDVIENIHGLDDLDRRVAELHRCYLELAAAEA